MKLKIVPHYNPVSHSVEFYVQQLNHAGQVIGLVTDLTVTTLTFDGNISQPSFRLDPQQTQDLADRLWQAGFQPAAANGSAGQLAAVNKHLDDMRKIAFTTLDIK